MLDANSDTINVVDICILSDVASQDVLNDMQTQHKQLRNINCAYLRNTTTSPSLPLLRSQVG